MGGVESAFQFISFKLDTFSLEVTRNLRTLTYDRRLAPNQVEMAVRIRNPLRLSDRTKYLGGLDVDISLYSSGNRTQNDKMVSARAGIMGLFKTVGSFEEETEQTLVRLQIPTILFPYLRAAVSTLLVSAGFPGIVLPLINVPELVRQTGDKIEIHDIESPESSEQPETIDNST
jgi:preprotein translocase subunit SecB